MSKKILIASKNIHKIEKFTQILTPYFDKIDSLLTYKIEKEIDENGETFSENAKIKSQELSKIYDGFVVATDAGANIPALGNNWNKLYTKRFVGEGKSDEDRIHVMLEMMRDKKDRSIFMTEAVALCKNGEVFHEIEVNSPIGKIKETWNGKHKEGAWLLSLWFLPHWNKDFLDLTPEEVKTEENTWREISESLIKYLQNV